MCNVTELRPGLSNKLYLLGFYHIAAKCAALAAEKKLNTILQKGVTLSIADVAAFLNFSMVGTVKFLRVLDAFELVEFMDETQCVKATALTAHLDYFLGTHLLHGYKIFENLQSCLEEDKACWDMTYKKDFYDYISSTPNESQNFAAWCKRTADYWLKGVMALYDFSKFNKIVDVGGSSGELLLSLLKQNVTQTAILFDLPAVIIDAELKLQHSPVIQMRRLELIGGSFFETIPPDGDLYILSRILLNWSDEDAIKIINNCFKVMEPGSKLLILDFVLPAQSESSYQQAVLSDINLYAVVHSSNRTKREWESLVKRTEFHHCYSYHQTISGSAETDQLIMPICYIELEKKCLAAQ